MRRAHHGFGSLVEAGLEFLPFPRLGRAQVLQQSAPMRLPQQFGEIEVLRGHVQLFVSAARNRVHKCKLGNKCASVLVVPILLTVVTVDIV
jgi:hypothetical protein